MVKKNFDIGYKIWLENDGMAFGLGPYYLLKNIQLTSSLSRAALELRMSYRQAWGLIKECEKRLGFDLIERQAGGASGGYSLLTAEGEKLLFWFEGLHDEIAKSVDKIFEKRLEKLN
jgi:molybdate transport system regulatory protein